MAMTSFYNTPFMLRGHTGGGIGEIWRSSAIGLLDGKRPHHYREFMKKTGLPQTSIPPKPDGNKARAPSVNSPENSRTSRS